MDNFEVCEGEERPEVEFITGQAGTGKTYHAKRLVEDDPSSVLCATTGIASVNLGEGVTTVNSLLHYGTTEQLKEKFYDGELARRLRYLYEDEGVRRIIVDEVSMMSKDQLDTLYEGLKESASLKRPIGLTVVGDFCQLPPVKEPFAFEADNWNEFASNTTKLTKVWRQEDKEFLEALNCYRRGDGEQGARLLAPMIEVASGVDEKFEGATILPKNDLVDRYNLVRLMELTSKPFTLGTPIRWGDPQVLKQWKDIPEKSTFKPGALVMIWANEPTRGEGRRRYVNGDLGTVIEYSKERLRILIELKRNGEIVDLAPIMRQQFQKQVPPKYAEAWKAGDPVPHSRQEAKNRTGQFDVYFDTEQNKWVIGEIYYFPLKLGYATTVHKSQGLTLDKVQIDLRDNFIGMPGMLYVALSRCRTPQGIRIVGSRKLLSGRCSVDQKVTPFL